MKPFSKLSSIAALIAAALTTGGALAQTSGSGAAAGGTSPADARPGQCFARVMTPEVFEIVKETVEDQPERTEVRTIPAAFTWVEQTIVTKEAATEYVVIPATYRSVTETIEVEPARTVAVATPEATETYTEQVLVRPAYTTWKPGAGVFGRNANAGRPGAGQVAAMLSPASASSAEALTSDVLCRVEVPAEYATVTRTRVVGPAGSTTRVVPAKVERITRQVLVTPARVEERQAPAETRTVRIRQLATPAREERVVVPASTRTVERRIVRRAATAEWREVLCQTNASPAKIAEIQRALSAAGYTTRATGAFGPQTLQAMERFQRDRGLAVGYLTLETVRALGVAER